MHCSAHPPRLTGLARAGVAAAWLVLAGCESGLRAADANAARARPVPALPDPALPPEPSAAAAPPPAPTTRIGMNETVVLHLRPAFRACYNAALQLDPLEEGTTTIDVRIDGTGHVVTATPTDTVGLATHTTECLAAVLRRRAVFEPPRAEGGRINVPLRFLNKHEGRATVPSTPGAAR